MKKITFLLFCLMTISFTQAQLNSVAIVGGGTPGGWPTGAAGEVDPGVMASTDGENWTISNIALSGEVKWRGNNSWAVPYNWGATSNNAFPTGTAVVNSGTAIGVPTGIYNVTFNSTTFAYSFTISNVFPVISLFGPAAGGADSDIDLGTLDGVNYSTNGVNLLAGAVRWRQNHDSATGNWGPSDTSGYPSGTAALNDPDAVIIPFNGIYNATFNTTTLAFSFFFPKVAIVGSATPAGWPANTPGEIDPQPLNTVDGVTYTLNSIHLTTGPEAKLKFRADNAWTKQWGSQDTSNTFPTGIGTQDGGDIFPNVESDYSVTFNVVTGAYTFAAPLANTQFNTTAFKAFPNPTSNSWNFTASNETIESIQVMDMTGKTVLSLTPKTTEANVDASGLSSGMYFAKVKTVAGSSTLKLVKE